MEDNFNGGFEFKDDSPESTPVTDQSSEITKKNNVAPVAESVKAKGVSKRGLTLTVAVIFVCALCCVLGTLFGNGVLGTNSGGTAGTASNGYGSDNVKGTESGKHEDEYVFETSSSGASYSIADVAAKTMDTVVEITTETVTTGGFMQQYVTEGAGSGVIIRKDGLVVTNHHVIDGASSITVRLRSGEAYPATLLGTDSSSDIALLKIEATGLPAAVLGDSGTLSVGDPVVAIGNPLGSLGGTVTDGIISALERQITIDGEAMTLLQTNAAINPGNSGGGLFNAAGELIGIVNAKSSGSGIEGLGFAIPINTAKPVFEDLLNYGYVRGRVTLGVSLLDIYSDSYVRYYGVPSQGTYISSVTADSDAERAGLKSADMLKSINGTAITSADIVGQILDDCEVGDTLTVTVVRVTSSNRYNYETEEITVNVTLTEYIPGSSLLS